jgi:hypothetical protein
VLLVFPYYQYYIDPDAVAYLTISKRYAAGEWAKAINGYWSPWSCWLTAAFIKMQFAPFLAAIIVNTIGATFFLFISQSYFELFDIRKSFQWILCTSIALFLVYAVFKQTFDDLWECFFLLTCVRIMLADSFAVNKLGWISLGIVGALAYFSKAYSFPFFIINTIIINYLLSRTRDEQVREAIIRSLVSIAVMLVCSSPWIYLLYDKYGEWMTSTAGKLNMSWYLVGYPIWKPELGNIIPPVYTDSPYYWEDPYISNGPTPQFWQTPKLFALLIVKCILNFAKFIISLNQISPFTVLIFLAAVGMSISKRFRSYFSSDKIQLMSAAFILFPAGFFIINYESRYIWFMLPISMTIGAVLFQRLFSLTNKYKGLCRAIFLVFASSYLVWPLLDMKQMYKIGADIHDEASILKYAGVKGSFTTIASYSGGKVPDIARLAYFSGCQYYYMPYTSSKDEVLTEMRRHKIKYYFYIPGNEFDDDYQFTDEAGVPFPEAQLFEKSRIKVFLVNP